MAGRDKRSWMERMVEHFVAEAPPKEGDANLHGSIAQLAALRMGGLDPRKVGLFAADVYRLVGKHRQQIIDDVAKLAPAASD